MIKLTKRQRYTKYKHHVYKVAVSTRPRCQMTKRLFFAIFQKNYTAAIHGKIQK